MRKFPKTPDLILGALPSEMLNRLFGFELDPGEVILSGAAQKHSAKRHPEDYPFCLPHISSIVTSPLYAGDDLLNPGKIELIGRIPSENLIILVAVNLEIDTNGCYHVASFYRISEKKVENRRLKGHLKIAL